MTAVGVVADAILDLVVPFARHRASPSRAGARAVVRMHRRQPAIAERPLRREADDVGVVPVDVGAAALGVGEPDHLG